jgi:hypothetical protein
MISSIRFLIQAYQILNESIELSTWYHFLKFVVENIFRIRSNKTKTKMQYKDLKDDIRRKLAVIRDNIRNDTDNRFKTSKKNVEKKITLLKITTC